MKKNVVIESLNVVTPSGSVLLMDSRIVVVPSRRYALVGRNGAGKSALLQLISEGKLPGWPPSITTVLVRQETIPGSVALLQSMLDARAAAWDRPGLEAERDALEARLEGADAAAVASLSDRLGEVIDLLETIDGPQAQQHAQGILRGLQFEPEDSGKGESELSSGWQQRLALAQALFVQPDVLLLDEPTNHMDLAAVRWLEAELTRTQATAVIVSHDPDFLTATCSDVLSIEEERLVHTAGGFESYLGRRQQLYRRDEAVMEKARVKEERLASSQKAQISIEDRHVARTLKKVEEAQKAHAVINVKALCGTMKKSGDGSAARAAQQKKAHLQRTLKLDDGERLALDSEQTPTKHNSAVLNASEATARVQARRAFERTLAFEFRAGTPLSGGAPLLRLDEASIGRPGRGAVLREVTLAVEAGARIAILGSNGVGKSTLGGAELLSGDVSRRSHLRVAYLRPKRSGQNHLEQLLPHQLTNSSQCLGAVSLAEHAGQRVGDLSGGERVRLILAAEVLPALPHLIVLDEPTNHLDLDSLDALKAGLSSFRGALLCISHHRDFEAGEAEVPLVRRLRALGFPQYACIRAARMTSGETLEARVEAAQQWLETQGVRPRPPPTSGGPRQAGNVQSGRGGPDPPPRGQLTRQRFAPTAAKTAEPAKPRTPASANPWAALHGDDDVDDEEAR
ncbi:hypothetical protein EMIHUDRAFT_450859 [Emiliania huxleyi CCMP1516]|uniref:ABC transporter domain-containing protein n=2 Tax=Emiliania huxleyi TaxID=2903 RepID=A0A0D3JBP9_EMIH1|nr:hypothetical protein EMIHUDRAFT_450859 [Emiliania huxleyi CCMP1516]EOD20934.1 hypothetical protein EMIHUDRAFT_450859 [Emiliania huxleyi CCMP1516]|eukprot:XP_005773363.1 hypothetical protein EMIHUDRAFT_450859 [Emiliania huxleyi CCMP1516]